MNNFEYCNPQTKDELVNEVKKQWDCMADNSGHALEGFLIKVAESLIKYLFDRFIAWAKEIGAAVIDSVLGKAVHC